MFVCEGCCESAGVCPAQKSSLVPNCRLLLSLVGESRAQLMEEQPLSGRSIDIELESQEVITIDLDNLDPHPADVLELLRESQCGVWVWTRLATEYWRKGNLDAAETIGEVYAECKHSVNSLSVASDCPRRQGRSL